jgi:hypothetical protein
MRLIPLNPEESARILLRIIARSDIQLAGRFTIVARDQVRQRLLP